MALSGALCRPLDCGRLRHIVTLVLIHVVKEAGTATHFKLSDNGIIQEAPDVAAVEPAGAAPPPGIFDHLEGIRNRHSLKWFPEPELAVLFDRFGGVDAALEKLEDATIEEPDSAVYWNDLGNAWRFKGDTTAAVECFRRALQLEPNNTNVSLNLATVLQNSGYLEDAEFIVRSTLKHAPHSFYHYFSLGSVLLAQDKRHEAADQFAMAIQLSPAPNKLASQKLDYIQGWTTTVLSGESAQAQPETFRDRLQAWATAGVTWVVLDVALFLLCVMCFLGSRLDTPAKAENVPAPVKAKRRGDVGPAWKRRR